MYMLSNVTAIAEAWAHLDHKSDKSPVCLCPLVHRGGVEEGDFSEACEDITILFSMPGF